MPLFFTKLAELIKVCKDLVTHVLNLKCGPKRVTLENEELAMYCIHLFSLKVRMMKNNALLCLALKAHKKKV